jgi:CrcB protein
MSGALDWRNLFAILAGGGIGSVLRYIVTVGVTQRFGPGFPWGTFLINVTGSLVIGVVFELSQTRAIGMSSTLRLFLMTGILGGYTTFSTFSLDLLLLFSERAPASAMLYAGASVVLGLAAAFAGVVLVRALTMHA